MSQLSMSACAVLSVVLVACTPDGGGSAGADQSATGPSASQVVTADAAAAAACGLDGSFGHQTDGATKTILTGGGTLAFRSDYAVNTDGAPNSYHPDDPAGNSGLAINTICNGAEAITASGERLGPRQCQRLLDTFRALDRTTWTGPGGSHMRFYAMSTVNGDEGTPCLTEGGPHDGAFISTTSLVADPSFGNCEQERFLNALNTNFIIRPGRQVFADAGMQLGDLAVVYDPDTRRAVFAVVGDTGPSGGLGEGSVAIGQRLGGRESLPASRAETYAFAMTDIVTVVLPGGPMGAPYTQARIDAAGAAALADFGGVDRIAGCAATLE